jgi:monomeric phenylalanine-4-hydroxylase
MEKYIVSQNYSSYEPEDHETWSALSRKQGEFQPGDLSEEYLRGIAKLNLAPKNIIRIEETSKVIESITGWSLVPVTGLIPTRDFFYMLISKKYPVTTSIRKYWEIDFSEQPDIFHDVYGHLPLLTSEKFTRFLTAYSIIALKYINNERAIDYLGRLYWFTYEMGLINEGGLYKPYGGAIITSANEVANTRNEQIPKHPFDLDHIFRTPYNSFKLQKEYFVINSFDDLFYSIEELESKLIEQLLLPQEDYTLRNFPLNKQLGEEFIDVIGFLNDIRHKFPEAVSFAAGQPDESFFNVESHIARFDSYVRHVMTQTGESRETVIGSIGQYNKTKGIINGIVSEYLHKDEDIKIDGDHILMTLGAQEAFAVIVSTICDREKDVILVEDPSYIGVNSFSRIFGYKTQGVPVDEEGIDIKLLKEKILEINKSGKTVKLLYTIPDYQNPTGCSMPTGSRLKLLELAQKYNFLIVEDSVYNSFTYAQKKNPTLKSLDRYKRVIYVGSFSKSLFPGLRMGLIAADQYVENDKGEQVQLID